ncbi:MAG: hypothetical protein KQH63_02910 [Desulfobulbaceae bacterium]|nr:hypothetical protein [Desulfobulbaceae bacterium]
MFSSVLSKIFTRGNDLETPDRVTFSWLLHFRWLTVASLFFLISAAYNVFEVNASLLISLILVMVVVASNIAFYVLLAKEEVISHRLTTAVMVFDVSLLTALFTQISCSLNPFIILYILYVFLGATLLRFRDACILICFSVCCYAVFYFFLSDPMVMGDEAFRKVAARGMLPPQDYMGAFTFFVENIKADLESYSNLLFAVVLLAMITIGFLVIKMKKSMDEQQKMTKDYETIKIRSEKLASLATLAAGAAHEFSTPLSTIAVASGEMLHYLREQGGSPDMIEDTRLIREQIGRCKEILYQMSADAGENLGENAETFFVSEIINEIPKVLSSELYGDVSFVNKIGDLQVTMPVRTLLRTLRGVLKNALEASEGEGPVEFICDLTQTHLLFQVKDHGSGMDEEMVKRATEPFFTTKEPGKGMGLGLYLAQVFVEKYDGSLEFDSEPGKGTTVTLSFSRHSIQGKEC